MLFLKVWGGPEGLHLLFKALHDELNGLLKFLQLIHVGRGEALQVHVGGRAAGLHLLQ